MKTNPIVFFGSAGAILLAVLLTAIFNERAEQVLSALQNSVVTLFGWFYILSVAFFLGFVLWIFFSRHGRIKLGKDEDEPEYSYGSWFAMLFTAGMGIGLLFYGVAEPVLHFAGPRTAEPETIAAAREAMTTTFFHWGLHAWAIYIIIGIALGYYGYRHGLPMTVRSTLYPIVGERIYGPIGHIVDILAVCGTMFGVATSLGLGVLQINAGADYLGLLDISLTNQMLLIAGITLLATTSVVMGLDKGIKRLSEFAILMALLLMVIVFFSGPTLFILSSFVQATGRYLQNLVEYTFRTDAFVGLDWQKTWTMFYWGWWISWSPFVGMFLARISRGRTLREFIGAVLFVPTVVTLFWMSVFGESALFIEVFGEGGMVGAVQENVSTALFVLLEQYPLSVITSTLAVLAIIAFFVTSSDSASLVIDTITAGGEEDAPVWQRIFWAVLEGVVAAVLLAAGGLVALQTGTLTMALPFCAVMVLACFGLIRSFSHERVHSETAVLATTSADEDTVEFSEPDPAKWKQRLDDIIAFSNEHRRGKESMEAGWQAVEEFLENVARPALEEVRGQLRRKGRNAEILREGKHRLKLKVTRGEGEGFTYTVQGHAYRPFSFGPALVSGREKRDENQKAEVVVKAGHGRQYPVRRWTREGIIQSFVDDYARWMNW